MRWISIRVIRHILATGLLLASASSGLTQGRVVCSDPVVAPENQDCPNNHIQTYVRATNSCVCPVTVTVHLKRGGVAILYIKSHSSGREMISACGPTAGAYTSHEFKFECPKDMQGTGPSKP